MFFQTWRHDERRAKDTAPDEVECRDFLFFARNRVVCGLLQYRKTNSENDLFIILKKFK